MDLKDQKHFLTFMLLIVAKIRHLNWVIRYECCSFENLFCRMQRIDQKDLAALLYENNYIRSLPSMHEKRIHTTFFFSALFFFDAFWSEVVIHSFRTLHYFMCKYTESDAPRCLNKGGGFRSYATYWRQWKIISSYVPNNDEVQFF